MPKKVVVGVVVSDKAAQTRRVEMSRLVKHPKYGKYIRSHDKYHAHDEANVAKAGDTVDISEMRPLSRLKRWRLPMAILFSAGPSPIASPCWSCSARDPWRPSTGRARRPCGGTWR